MRKGTVWQRVGDFIVGKGFYIVLFLCVATIGISGYYLVSAFTGGEEPSTSVVGGAHVVIPPDDSSTAVTQPPADTPPVQTLQPDGSTLGDPSDPAGLFPPIRDTDPSQPDSSAPQNPPEQTQDPAPKPEPEPEPEPQPASPPPAVYTWPVKGEILSSFSLEVLAYDETMGDWRTHSGVDIAAAVGTRVMALRAGTVSRVYEDDLMGTAVVIDHGDGLVSSYYNLSPKPTVSEGDQVSTGTVIGSIGETALAEIGRPSHLHLELALNGRQVDPIGYLPKY